MVTHMTRNRIEERSDQMAAADGRSLTGLVRELRDEAIVLVRQEVALARTEMSEKAARVARNSAFIGVGAFLAYAGLFVLLLAGVVGLYLGLVAAGLTHATAGWLSPLIIGAVLAVVGYVFIQKGLSTLKHESIVPERTVESIKADKEWMEEKVT
jgi:uncharacterized membrane protein YqjE